MSEVPVSRFVWVWLILAVPANSAGPTPREASAAAAYEATFALYQGGQVPVEDVYRWSKRWYDAQHDAANPRAAAAHTERMKALADRVHQGVMAGIARSADETATAWYLAEAAELK